jgi:hypothetical protein
VGADLWGWHSNVAGQRYAKLAMEAAATGAHNVVTYFTNATDLRGTALCCREPGRGRRIGVSAAQAGSQAGLLFPGFTRTEEKLLDLPITSDKLRGPNDARASGRPTSIHRSTRKTSAAKFAMTEF